MGSHGADSPPGTKAWGLPQEDAMLDSQGKPASGLTLPLPWVQCEGLGLLPQYTLGYLLSHQF